VKELLITVLFVLILDQMPQLVMNVQVVNSMTIPMLIVNNVTLNSINVSNVTLMIVNFVIPTDLYHIVLVMLDMLNS
jgi:hypothetical protein